MSDLSLWKLICEIRYPTAVLLADNMGNIANRWQGKYGLTDWEINLLESVTIHDKDRIITLRTGLQKSSAFMEIPENYEEFSDLATSFFVTILSILKIEKINRIGFRVIQLAEIRDIEVSVTDLRTKLFRLQDEEWDILGGHPTSTSLTFTFDLGKNKANFRISTLRKETFVNIFDSPKSKKMLPSFALIVDFDLFVTNPSVKKRDFKKFIEDFLLSGQNEVQDRVIRFVTQYGGFQE